MQTNEAATRITSDQMDPARAAALHVTLGLEGTASQAGTALLPFFHQAYFWHLEAAGKLGRDGHPAVGGFIPDFGLPRRMWAGGRLNFIGPLRAGVPAQHHSRVLSAERKTGRTGRLAFVTLCHEFWQRDGLCVREEQDLVYREEPDPSAPEPAPALAPGDSDPLAHAFSSTLLFRYSALTFNGHRIHYDVDYARDVEGYAGVVVHGPLLAQLLMLRAHQIAPMRAFSFRGVRALTLGEDAVSNRDGEDFWIRNADGHLIMTAKAAW